MVLKLKHLSPYLPYNLEAYWTDNSNIEISASSIMNVIHRAVEYPNDKQWKPLLRPLSKLTTEITIDGETFIPLVRLYEISRKEPNGTCVNYEFVKSWGDNMILKSHIYKNQYNDFTYFDLNFYSSNINLDKKVSYDNILLNQYYLHVMLFEWHFDVFGLIKEGFALELK